MPRIRTADYLSVTELATKKLFTLLHKKPDASGIKVTFETKGCSGLKYKMQYAYSDKTPELYAKDDVKNISWDSESSTIYIDGKYSLYLIGTTLDYEETDTESGFVFVNPNEKSRCGCGESFNV